MKNLIIISFGAATIYLLYSAYKKSKESIVIKEAMPNTEPRVELQLDMVCPEGEILCENKSKCYNQLARYIINPCNSKK